MRDQFCSPMQKFDAYMCSLFEIRPVVCINVKIKGWIQDMQADPNDNFPYFSKSIRLLAILFRSNKGLLRIISKAYVENVNAQLWVTIHAY